MNTEKTFIFHGVEYDTERFLKSQMLFKKIRPTIPAVIDEKQYPFVSESVKLPIIMQYEGKMIFVACPANAFGDAAVKYADNLLITKHTLKSYAYVDPAILRRQEQEDQRSAWRDDNRGYNNRGYNNDRRPYSDNREPRRSFNQDDRRY